MRGGNDEPGARRKIDHPGGRCFRHLRAAGVSFLGLLPRGGWRLALQPTVASAGEGRFILAAGGG